MSAVVSDVTARAFQSTLPPYEESGRTTVSPLLKAQSGNLVERKSPSRHGSACGVSRIAAFIGTGGSRLARERTQSADSPALALPADRSSAARGARGYPEQRPLKFEGLRAGTVEKTVPK